MHDVVFLARFFHPDISATSQLVSDLGFDLVRTGFRVSVITSRQCYEDPKFRLSHFEEVDGVRAYRVWTTRFGRSGLPGRLIDYMTFYISASWRLLWLAGRGTTIIATTDPPLISIPALVVARLRGARLINWLQDVFPEVAQRLGALQTPWLIRPLLWMRNRALRGACANVVIGSAMSRFVQVQCGRTPHVIPNWALEEVWTRTSGTIHPLRAAWGLDDAFVVGYSGNMGRVHRLDILIQAAELLRGESGIVFLMVGGGAQRAELEARVQDLGLSNVIFRPYQPRESLRESLTLPDIQVVSLDARLEALVVPSKFVGVIAVGRSVLFLGDRQGEIGRLVAESGCGVVADPDDPQALAAVIRRLAADRSVVMGMRAAAQDLWARKFRRRDALNAWRGLLASTSSQTGLT